jgi:hypothetical protein
MLTAFFDKDGEENPQLYAVLNKQCSAEYP